MSNFCQNSQSDRNPFLEYLSDNFDRKSNSSPFHANMFFSLKGTRRINTAKNGNFWMSTISTFSVELRKMPILLLNFVVSESPKS